MVWHTVRALVRPSWTVIVLLSLSLAILAGLFAADDDNTGGSARLINIAFLVQISLLHQLTPTRETWLAPLSRRQLWLARWLAVVVVPAAATTVIVWPSALAGVWLSGRENSPTAIAGAIALLAFSYAGCLMALIAASEFLGGAGSSRLASFCRGLVATTIVPVFVVGFWFRNESFGPVDLLQAPAIWFLLAGAGLAALAAFYSPAPGTYERLFPPRAEHGFLAGRAGRASRLDGLTGITGLVAHEVRFLVATTFSLMAALAVGAMVINRLQGRSPLLPDDALVFAGRLDGGPLLLVEPLLVMLARDGLLAGLSTNHLFSTVRQLRLMPVATSRLMDLLMLRRIVGWTCFWLAMLSIQVLAFGWPERLYLDWLLWAIGIDLLVDAIRFRFALTPMLTFLLAVFVVAGSGWAAVGWLADAALPLRLAAVLGGLAAAALARPLYRHALTRGEWLLRPTGHPVMTPP